MSTNTTRTWHLGEDPEWPGTFLHPGRIEECSAPDCAEEAERLYELLEKIGFTEPVEDLVGAFNSVPEHSR